MPLLASKRIYRDFLKAYRAGNHAVLDGDEPKPQRADPAKRKDYRADYKASMRPFLRGIVVVFTLALIASILGLILPAATQYAVDHILLGNRDRTQLMWFGIAMLLLVFAQQAVFMARQWKMAVLNAKVITRFRRRLFRHLLHMPLGELADMKTGRIVSRLSGDLDQVTGLLQVALITPGVSLMKVILTIVMLLWINWKMALVATVLLPPLTIINLIWVKKIRPVYRALRKDRADIDGRVTEVFGGIRVVRGFAREIGELRHYAVANHAVARKGLYIRRFEQIVTLGWGLLIPMVSLVVIWYGGLRLLAGEVTIGGIMAFQMYIMMLLEPVSVIVNSYGETQQSLAAMERVFDILRRPIDKPDSPTAVEAPLPIRLIEFMDVSFSYRPERPVLHDVNLDVEAGQTIALVGPSGSGKTTMTHMVARFYDPTRGVIRLNGIDLRQIRLRSFRGLLGYVPQDVFLFDGTVHENIAFGLRHATREQVRQAAERANAHEFIAKLPDGYDSIIGERGVKLSGGQAQRISIARAFLADPQILILDEATSNLDTESEELIQASMIELIAGRTTFIIAHRLSTIMHADKIVVIEDGRISEVGTHAELMARGEHYREMVQRQTRRSELAATN